MEVSMIDGEELRTIIETSMDAPQLVPGTEAERRQPAPPPAVAPVVSRPAVADTADTAAADPSG